MSSLVRRLQIRALKRKGFVRTPYQLVAEPDGRVRAERVSRGGVIVDPEGKPIGYHWPLAGIPGPTADLRDQGRRGRRAPIPVFA